MDFKELLAYKKAFSLAMEIKKVSDSFPKEEKYALTDQVRRSSRSVCANIAEAYRKRRYINHFISKLTDSDGENSETSVWLDFALECEYIDNEFYNEIYKQYDMVLGMLVKMIVEPEKWSI